MALIRAMEERDLPGVDALWADVAVPWTGARASMRVGASIPSRLLVAEDERDGGIVGYAGLFLRGMWRDPYAPIRLRVADSHRGRGIGRALWDAMATTRAAWESSRFVVQIDEDDTPSRETARRHGGVEAGLHIVSHLDLDSLPPLAEPPDPRVRIHRPVLSDPGERDRLYRFLIERGEDAPDAGPGMVLIQREVFDQWFTEGWQAVVLRVDETDVALTTATRDGGDAHIVFTGVVPEFRGRRLATWVKQVHAHDMRNAGFRRLRTENMSTNAAILAVNASAGFRPTGAYVDVAFDPS